MEYTFTVYGVPVPQGSLKAFHPKGCKHPVLTSDNTKLKPWRQQVAEVAMIEATGRMRPTGGVEVHVDFFFDKPKSAPKKVTEKTTKPDIDKLLRGILDALTGIAYVDDAQVVRSSQSKQFGSPARAVIRVVAA